MNIQSLVSLNWGFAQLLLGLQDFFFLDQNMERISRTKRINIQKCVFYIVIMKCGSNLRA